MPDDGEHHHLAPLPKPSWSDADYRCAVCGMEYPCPEATARIEQQRSAYTAAVTHLLHQLGEPTRRKLLAALLADHQPTREDDKCSNDDACFEHWPCRNLTELCEHIGIPWADPTARETWQATHPHLHLPPAWEVLSYLDVIPNHDGHDPGPNNRCGKCADCWPCETVQANHITSWHRLIDTTITTIHTLVAALDDTAVTHGIVWWLTTAHISYLRHMNPPLPWRWCDCDQCDWPDYWSTSTTQRFLNHLNVPLNDPLAVEVWIASNDLTLPTEWNQVLQPAAC